MDALKAVIVPINREGWPFITLFAVVSIVLGLLWQPLFWVGLVLTLWCTYFFRDPDRVTPTRSGLVISPADGVVNRIVDIPPPPELEMGDKPLTCISVFMNVFNVHVNRAPVDGVIKKLHYHPGKFLSADLDKAAEENERMSYLMETPREKEVAFVQIAGLVARRIICEAELGDELKAGERFGLIRFGSRVDIYLPKGTTPLVCKGQLTVAGETVLADLGSGQRGKEGPRVGEVR
ncbi:MULTISPECIES: phosphatidylserine decarboxylase [Curvivirga]|uniref:phosphatidylserine decarboxylase n=1 Tax=Curvivirga TaxID=2856846 RepID=UPI0012BD71DB|nr:phosphatidylserine decarboxylase [Curvivirga aplysinae]MTI10014.1 phosphatidylserine decarboxylase [Curvivirga aplysinae]